MRIIDKQHDFYDYLQDSSDKIVFDRRGSFILTKDELKWSMNRIYSQKSKYRFLLLQCGASFWLFLITITDFNDWGNVQDYNIELLSSWKNYNKPIELLKFNMITFGMNLYKMKNYKFGDYSYDKIKSNLNDIKSAIDNNDCEFEKIFHYSYDAKKDGYPLLKACGFGNIMDATETFCAIEEYFSMKKTASETTEAKGATNDDKIIMHGFDTKTSFRGNNKA